MLYLLYPNDMKKFYNFIEIIHKTIVKLLELLKSPDKQEDKQEDLLAKLLKESSENTSKEESEEELKKYLNDELTKYLNQELLDDFKFKYKYSKDSKDSKYSKQWDEQNFEDEDFGEKFNQYLISIQDEEHIKYIFIYILIIIYYIIISIIFIKFNL